MCSGTPAISTRFRPTLPQLRKHLDPSLLMIDVGCGNGRFTRRLAAEFSPIMGLDLSPNAVALARRESAGASDIDFRVLDLTVPGSTAGLAEEFETVNIFVRGVFHILNPADRAVMARNLLPLVGARGRVFLAETNFRGSSLGYLESLGATPRSIPEPLERAIRDLPRPGHFGAEERSVTFPPGRVGAVGRRSDGDRDHSIARSDRARADSGVLRGAGAALRDRSASTGNRPSGCSPAGDHWVHRWHNAPTIRRWSVAEA